MSKHPPPHPCCTSWYRQTRCVTVRADEQVALKMKKMKSCSEMDNR